MVLKVSGPLRLPDSKCESLIIMISQEKKLVGPHSLLSTIHLLVFLGLPAS